MAFSTEYEEALLGWNGMAIPRRTTAPVRVSGVIVNPDDIRKLADFVWRQYQHDLEKLRRREREQESFIWFTLTRSDGRTYEGHSMNVACEGQVLETKKIVEFEIAYEDNEEQKSIVVDLRHDSMSFRRDLAIISGFNEEWVEAMAGGISDLVNGWRKQPRLVQGKRLLLLSAVPLVGFGLVTAAIFRSFMGVDLIIEPALYLVSFIFAAVPTVAVSMFVRGLYPDFELLMGPEHSQRERGMRRKLVALLTLFVVPLIVGILLELSKPLWAR